MILTVIQDTEQTQLKAPVFILDRQEIGIVASGSSITVTEIPEEPEERQAFFSDEDNGYLILGSTATAVEHQATINPVWDGRLPAPLRKVNTINGVGANAAGEFFIDGSECDSWGYIKNGIAEGSGEVGEEVWFVRRNKATGELIKYKYPNGFGIWLTDACPACTSCETIYRLKYEVENLKMWLNTLKDVNMYTSTLYGDVPNHVGYRRDLLKQQRITEYNEDQACSTNLQPDDKYMQLQGIQLLQQYMTVVHMWNYVVSRNNSSTLITIAPEDTTGFVVQTKRALTSCANTQSIRCCIDVQPCGAYWDTNPTSPGGFPGDYQISIYVPEKSNRVSFEPFDSDVQQQNALNGIYTMTIRTRASSLVQNQPVAYKQADTSPTLTPDYIDAKVAGTYVVTTKFLPFIYYRAWRGLKSDGSKNYITMRGGKQDQDIQPYPVGDTGAVIYNFGLSDVETGYLERPTEQDYLDAKTAPTCSVPFKIMWDITVTWQIAGEKPDVENYRYMANGIRAYYSDASVMSNTTVLPLEPEEPVSSGAQT